MAVELRSGALIGEIPPTPAQPIFSAEQSVPTAYKTLLSTVREFGHAVSYAQEQSGNLVQNILPVHKTEYRQISTSSKTELELHTETAFHPHKPDYVFLLCLRGDESAFTTFANSDDFLSELDDETLETLQLPLYNTRIDESFRAGGLPDLEIKMPILKRNAAGDFDCTYDRNFMTASSAEGEKALQLLYEAISSNLRKVSLRSGDILIIHNASTVHGRLPFQPRYDGTDRWVLRCLGVAELPDESQLDGHVITTRFDA